MATSRTQSEKTNFTSVVATALIFVVVVGAVTWVVQYMPNYRSAERKSTPITKNDNAPKELVAFNRATATWDANDPDYVKEYERGSRGHYDFFVESKVDEALEFGLFRTSCDCTSLEFALLPRAEWDRLTQEQAATPGKALDFTATWTKLEPGETKLASLPAASQAVVRITWNGKKESGSRLRLGVEVFAQPNGEISRRVFQRLEVPVVMAMHMMFEPSRLYFGPLAPMDKQVGDFTVWSATRDRLDVRCVDKDEKVHPNFEFETRPLSTLELQQLQASLKEKKNLSRVLSATRVKVTVHEQRNGSFLHQGVYQQSVYMKLPEDEEITPGPLMIVTVKSDVEVGAAEDRGMLDLKSFSSLSGVSKRFVLWTENNVELESTKDHVPSYIEVKLGKDKLQTRAGKTKWILQVTVPGGVAGGAFPENSVIILRIPGNSPRYLRIPVVGTAAQG